MPIVKDLPDAPSPLKPNTPKALAIEAKSVVVDTKYTPLASLIAYVVGASWTVDYFSQLIDVDNDLNGLDVNQSPLHQQYTKIRGLELKVSSALQSSQDENNRMVVSGTANVYPFVIPNVGDMFAADVGDGREGVFRIKNVEKKSYMTQAIYSIDYELQFYSSDKVDFRKTLDIKSVRTVFFLKDFLLNGQNPLLIEEDFNAVQTLGDKFDEITRNYLNWFFNPDHSTLTMPGQDLVTYDHFVTDAVLSILTTRSAPQVKFIRRLNVDSDVYLKQPQLYKALTTRDRSLLDLSNRTMGLISVKLFSQDPALETIAYGGIKYMVYPKDPDTSLNSLKTPDPKAIADGIEIARVPTRPGNIVEIIGNIYIDNVTVTVPPIITVNLTDGYVLSKAFYENGVEESLLEVLVNAYFDKKAINPLTLAKLVDTYKNWGGLERFYYLPIILILIKSVISTI